MRHVFMVTALYVLIMAYLLGRDGANTAAQTCALIGIAFAILYHAETRRRD